MDKARPGGFANLGIDLFQKPKMNETRTYSRQAFGKICMQEIVISSGFKRSLAAD